MVNFWDGQSQKRLKQLAKYPTSIAALSFNNDGSVLAVASSYTFEEGEREYVFCLCFLSCCVCYHDHLPVGSHPQDSIFLHKTQEVEVKPKPRAG